MNFFFPRGKGPLVSILLPTRGRPDHLAFAIDSLCSFAIDVSNLEFCLKIDDDDQSTIDMVTRLEYKLPIKKVISPRGKGYCEIHNWINELASISTGDWLYVVNDDFRMTTQGWDQTLLYIGCQKPWIGISDVCCIYSPTIGRPFAQEFMFLRKKTYEILGHYSLSPHCDNWIYSIMNFLGCVLTVDIKVDHYSHLINDKTREESVEAYKHTSDSLISIDTKENKFKDASKLLNYMRTIEDSMVWESTPVEGDGWYWVKFDKAIENVLYDSGNINYFKDGAVSRQEKLTTDSNFKWCRRL